MCDLVTLYDNTEEVAIGRIAIYKNFKPNGGIYNYGNL